MNEKLKEEIKRKKIDIHDLADELNLSLKQLDKKLNGKDSFTRLEICKIAEHFTLKDHKSDYYKYIDNLFS